MNDGLKILAFVLSAFVLGGLFVIDATAVEPCHDFGSKSEIGIKKNFTAGELTARYNEEKGTGLRWYDRLLARR